MFYTPLCKLLGIRYPIIQGALGGTGRPVSDFRLTASVSSAGGLGVLATWMLPNAKILREIERVRELTDKPFGINIAAVRSSYDFSKKARLIAKAGVRVVTTGRGDPNIPAISILKEHGITVIPVVGSVRQAISVERKGADAVVASGYEGGGHVGSIATMPLVPQVVNAVRIPVVAAGGIGDATGFVAALALGASGIQMGTRFLATEETILPLPLKEKILRATAEDAVVSTMRTGWPTRVLKSRFTEEWDALTGSGVSKEVLRDFRRMVVKRTREDIAEDTVGAGQVCGMLDGLMGAAQLIQETIRDARRIVSFLGEVSAEEPPREILPAHTEDSRYEPEEKSIHWKP